MSLHFVHPVSDPNFPNLHDSTFDHLCSVCNEPVSLETANTDEIGLAVHEHCYVLKLSLKNAVLDAMC